MGGNPKETWKVFEDFKESYSLLRKDESGSGDSVMDVLKKWANEIGGQNGLLAEAMNYLENKGDHRADVSSLVKKPSSKRKTAEIKAGKNFNMNFLKQLNSEEDGVIKFLLEKQTRLEQELKSCLDSVRPPSLAEIKSLTNKVETSPKENDAEQPNLTIKNSISTLKNAILSIKNRTPNKQCRRKLNQSDDSELKELECVVKKSKNKGTCSKSANEFHLLMLEDLKNEINSFNNEVKKAEDLKKVIKNQECFKKQLQTLEEKMSKDKKAWLKERKMWETSFKCNSKSSTITQQTCKKGKKKKSKSTNRKAKQDQKLTKILENLQNCVGKQQEEISRTRKEVEKLKVFMKKINEFIENQEKRSKELPKIIKENVESEINRAFNEKEKNNIEIASLHEELRRRVSSTDNNNKSMREKEPPLQNIGTNKFNKEITLNIDKDELEFLLHEKDPASCLLNYNNGVPQISKEIELQRQLMEQAMLEEQQFHEMFESSEQKLYEMKTTSKRFKSRYNQDR